MPTNERAFLQKISASTPEELIEAISHADTKEERLLRIYLGSEQYDAIRRMSRQMQRSGGKLGNVVVLHGIMGGELTLFSDQSQDLIWVQALRLLLGKFDQLTLNAEGFSERDVRPSGIYMRFYGSQLASLSQDWTVRPFFYDWRRDLRVAADELFQSINSWFGPDSPVNLVAHSMGGLVARSYISRHRERWDKGGRLVMLGTPNCGSFAVPRLLFGTNDVLSIIAKIDFSHNSQDLLNIAKTFKGVYQMMPVRGKLDGLDVLYRSATYSRATIDQSLLDEAEIFQASIAGMIDPARMTYVAGYNRRTLAGITDPTQLGSDAGYLMSRKGDGTVPHNLGLLPDVKTFYVDEEHQNLPGNAKVQGALTELLQTGALATEDLLFKGLSAEFAGDRGLAEESQTSMQTGEAARRSIKEQQAIALRNLLTSRGAASGDTVSVEEQALADVIMRHEALPLAVGGLGNAGTGALLGEPIDVPIAAPQANAQAESAISTSALVPPRPTKIRVHVAQQRIDQITSGASAPEIPIDCIAVGHYLHVRPTGAEHDLDREISRHYFKGHSTGEDATDDLLLLQFHDRGILRGELGVPFYIPDPRPGQEGTILAIAGMGATGGFGVPELTLLARELTWSLGQLGKKHLATVLIGVSKKNLSIADAIHGWMAGLNRSLASAANNGGNSLEAITFVVRPSRSDQENRTLSLVVSALQREAHARKKDPMSGFDIQLMNMPTISTSAPSEPDKLGATRISIDFEDGLCRYSALTDVATIPERVFRITQKRITDINTRLLSTDEPKEKYRLGKFLLDFLFPRDLRSQLTGGAPIVLACNNEAARVYWELAAQPLEDEDLTVLGDQPYLGLARGLTRQLRTVIAPPPEPPPPVARTLRVLLVADACREHPLPGARREAQQLLELFERVNAARTGNRIIATALVGPSKATTLDVLLNINDHPPYDVLHYAGHCVFDKDHPDRSGFLFSDNDRLTAADLDRIDRTPKFVFANACESGVLPSRPDLSSPDLPAAFALQFFAKGVANFICTAWPIGDVPSSSFALELYRNLLGDRVPVSPMYEALRRARQRIVDTHTWGAYQHYGNPYFRLFRSGTST
jgi:pimeloyl-ACP methyl ester carboxylesterase